MNRNEAIEIGKKRYDSGPCKNCGGTIKYVSTRSCVECLAERKRTYDKTPQFKSWMRNYDQIRRTTPEGVAKVMFQAARVRARNRGIPFSTTCEEIAKLLVIATEKWKAAINIEFDYSVGSGRPNAFGPSLDQITAGLGYPSNNIQVVPWVWNAFKSDYFTDAEAIDFCCKIADAYRNGRLEFLNHQQ